MQKVEFHRFKHSIHMSQDNHNLTHTHTHIELLTHKNTHEHTYFLYKVYVVDKEKWTK